MGLRITQFHLKRSSKSCIAHVPSGAKVYFDGVDGAAGTTSKQWVIYAIDNPLGKLPLTLRYAKYFRPQSVQIVDETVNPLRSMREVIQLRSVGNRALAHVEHRYLVVSSPRFMTRKPSIDRIYDPVEEPFRNPDPPGSVIERSEGYDLVVRDRSSWRESADLSVTAPLIADLLGLQFGVDVVSESSHAREIEEKRTKQQKTTTPVPPNVYSLQALVTTKFLLGFQVHTTSDNGGTWNDPIDYQMPIEVRHWPRIYDSTPERCHRQMQEFVEGAYKQRVVAWLSKTLERAGLAPLGS